MKSPNLHQSIDIHVRLLNTFQILILFYLSVTVSLIASVGGILMGVVYLYLSFFVTLSRNQSIKQVHFMNSFLSNLNELFKGSNHQGNEFKKRH